MATKGKRAMRSMTANEKMDAIRRVNDGESKASVARDIGVPESTLRGWCKNEDKLRFMTSRLSSPESDKSSDGEPPDKRARTVSPAAPASPAAGLDLTTPTTSAAAALPPLQPAPPPDAPVELTTKRSLPSPTAHAPRDRRADPGANVSMSAISPLSGLPHLPSLAHSQFGLSFNEIASNLTLLAQLNPGLASVSAPQSSRALRSVRSPKPAHNGILNLNEPKHRSKSHHHSTHENYRTSLSKSSHYSTPPSAAPPVDDSLWYWLKAKAMLDLTAQSTTACQLQMKPDHATAPKPVAPTVPLNASLDYNRAATGGSWIYEYYKQFGNNMAHQEDKLKSASQVPKEKTAETILYSHLTKEKRPEEEQSAMPATVQSPVQISEKPKLHSPNNKESRLAQPAASPELGTENKEPSAEKSQESARHQTKVRTVLDNLLYDNSQSAIKEAKNIEVPNGEWELGAAEALEHGDKFLAWLEASGDPSVTRLHVHQLRALLHNLRARRVPPTHDHAARRN